jgi:hypothetical protein
MSIEEATKSMPTYDMYGSFVTVKSSFFGSLPHYEPQVEMVREYYSVGYDKANTMLGPFLTDKLTPTETLSFLFAGIADSCHLLQMFQSIVVVKAENPNRPYHFTVNDVKAEVFARDLLFFLLLDQLAKELPSRDTQPRILSKDAWWAFKTL